MNKKSNKTAHVMKLLAGGVNQNLDNPILNESFKEEMILNRNTLHEEENMSESSVNNEEQSVKINVIAELVAENIDEAIERFNCCSCELCRAEITASTLEAIGAQYAQIKNNNTEELEMKKNEFRNLVVSTLVKNIIKLKLNPIHS